MNHPLTDEMVLELVKHVSETTDWNNYDKYPSTLYARAAADWQLEKDAEYFAQYLVKNFGLAPEVAELRAEWFKEAMRPQEDD